MPDGTLTHAIGQFSNPGTPHRFRAQAMTICVDAAPRDASRITLKTNASVMSLAVLSSVLARWISMVRLRRAALRGIASASGG
ncbi:MAG: hypothetical protein AAF231_16055 [Pseudomonadota bacterium]